MLYSLASNSVSLGQIVCLVRSRGNLCVFRIFHVNNLKYVCIYSVQVKDSNIGGFLSINEKQAGSSTWKFALKSDL